MSEITLDDPHLQAGSRLVVRVIDIAFGGEGVARFHELVVFVPFVALGEEVEIEITELKKRFARAKLIRVVTPSPDRVAPRCRYFGECGGCQYQHLAYEAQLKLKHKQIVDLLQRIGGIPEVAVEQVIPCPQPYGYRNRIMIRSQWDKFKQGLNIGFIRAENRLVVDIEECVISEPPLNEQLRRVRANPPPKGGIKVVLRMLPTDWDVPKDSFFQNNFHLLPRLVETVRDRIQRSGVRHLIDLYCGVGFFAIETADLVETFAGVEVDRMAVSAARRNATSRGITNGEFVEGRAEELLPRLLEKFRAEQSAVILDPPRTGCPRESLELLRAAKPARIIYVSCHPATLARDIQLLCEDGTYRVLGIVPLDMFPQTQHVECVAELGLVIQTSDHLNSVGEIRADC